MAPKRAFGGVLRPFGGGFRGPNRERASVFSGAGRGRAGGSAVEPGRDQRVQRRGTGRCRWFCGGARRRSQRVQRRRTGAVQGVLRWSRGGAGVFSGGARCGTGAEQAGVLRRRRGRGRRVQRRGIGAGRGVQRCRRDGPAAGREGGGMASRPPPRPLPKAAAGCKADGRAAGSQKKVFRREDAPAARTQKKCSEGKVRRRPNTYGHKKNGPRSVHFYFCYTTLLLYGLLLRDARPIHPVARQRLRTPGARLFCGRLPAACSPATACLPSISVCPSVGGHSRESLRHPEPQPLSRPPVGAQPPGRRNLSRPGSPP